MKKTALIIFLSMTFITTAQAEVFKCKLASGKIIYQSMPCPTVAVDQNIVEIKKLSPRQLEEAQNKLKAWQARQAEDEAAKIKAAKEEQEELDRQETINALNRNAIAQQQQAEALKRRNNYNGPYYGPFFYTPQYYGPPYHPPHHHHEKQHHDNRGPREHPGSNRPVYPQDRNPMYGRQR
jgi:Skp family chaperone for outer membrane proteins